MGALCSKSSDHGTNRGAFNTPGRRLGETPPQPTTAPVPKKYLIPPAACTRGGGGGGGDRPAGLGSDLATQSWPLPGPDSEAKTKAAAAAEARLATTAKKGTLAGGKLSAQLAAQKRQTQEDALRQTAEENRRYREIDQVVRERIAE